MKLFSELYLEFLSPSRKQYTQKEPPTFRRLWRGRGTFEYSSILYLAQLKSFEVPSWCMNWEVLVVVLLRKRLLAITRLPHPLSACPSYSGYIWPAPIAQPQDNVVSQLLLTLWAIKKTLQRLAGNHTTQVPSLRFPLRLSNRFLMSPSRGLLLLMLTTFRLPGDQLAYPKSTMFLTKVKIEAMFKRELKELPQRQHRSTWNHLILTKWLPSNSV